MVSTISRPVRSNTTLQIDRVLALFRARGHSLHDDGGGLSHMEHGLRCAKLAEEAGAPVPLIAAALLHDIGHLLDRSEGNDANRTGDRHAAAGANLLDAVLGPTVAFPVRWHQDARRWLATSRTHCRLLSYESRRAALRDGGVMGKFERETFLCRPFSSESITLCLWEERAKGVRGATPSLEHFARLIQGHFVPTDGVVGIPAGYSSNPVRPLE
ncbi:HD domain-containing protein [Ideonella sp. DXS29W]|uniref:HD domain-containing protein n=1 Tax=Ideonella lacteola TaxID=2984193 RepID=A0ABU9BYG7_9BURK